MFVLDIVATSHRYTPSVVLSKVFSKLHKAFVGTKDNFAISFPRYNYTDRGCLGNVITIGSTSKTAIEKLQVKQLLEEFKDDIFIMPNVMQTDNFRYFKRVHCPNTSDSIIKRRTSIADIGKTKNTINSKRKNAMRLAYVDIISSSTNQRFSLFVKPIDINNGKAELNTYGLVTNVAG